MSGSCGFKVAASLSKSPPYSTKFGADRHCVSGDKMGFVCHVIPRDQVIKGSCEFMADFMGGRYSWNVTSMPSLVATWALWYGSGDKMVLVCHLILLYHVRKGSCNFMGRSP